MKENKAIESFRSLLREVDSVFASMGERFPEEVRCKAGCVDCCHAFFDMSFVEAFYLHMHLLDSGSDKKALEGIRSQAAQAKDVIDRYVAGLSKDRTGNVPDEVSRWRVRCPLLSKDDTCAGYAFRPVTCRVYGVPTSINGKGHVCGYSGFDKGESYPTVKLDAVNAHLLDLSRQLADELSVGQDRASRRFFVHEVVAEFDRFLAEKPAAEKG